MALLEVDFSQRENRKKDWLPRHPQGEAPEGTGSYYADEAEEIENSPPTDF